ncbi:hypothetical protein ACFOGI_09640 [Virgibacillus xinjiangensis]|uniref:DUF2524 domain-containing protein n=1 Tax=Virgibacillus xinjiangensis TaxID=393090 RepID=A0ABV7CVK7_9BACI
MSEHLHQQLQKASHQIDEAQEAIRLAQGQDEELLEKAHDQLQHAEWELQQAQHEAGKEATENPQFQQAYQQLHDTRQQVQEAKQNNHDVL